MGIEKALTDAQGFLEKNNPLGSNDTNNFRSNGFLLPPNYSADGTGLPYSKVPTFVDAQLKRNIITWFLPEFGIVKMYINPDQIRYTFKKLIQQERTKGGYSLQYWGEELPTLSISGTTGSSGVEGINMLYEIYRAEQLAFDSSGLLIAQGNSSNNFASDLLGDTLGADWGNIVGTVGGITNQSPLSFESYPTLASLAFGVEMYYGGWVFRGYFNNMNMTERSDNFLWSYDMEFVVTQKRGYRRNYFPWSRNPAVGPSSYLSEELTQDDTKKVSFSGKVNGT